MTFARTVLSAVVLSASVRAGAQEPAKPQLLLRIDDIGMNHAVNLALADIAATRMPVSASVMFACPWYQEAVEILRRNPQISVGVHLVLNSEWRGYRWGPVLGKAAVPSLVDSVGYFRPSTAEFLASPYDLGEVERELTAQVERAVRSGLKIDYVDYHMGTSVATPELRAVVERVAERFGVGVSRYFGEAYFTTFAVPIADKQSALLKQISSLTPGTLNLVVVHAARATPDMTALIDMNNADQNMASVAGHRAAELEMMLSPALARLRESGNIELVNYGGVIARRGRASMRRPP